MKQRKILLICLMLLVAGCQSLPEPYPLMKGMNSRSISEIKFDKASLGEALETIRKEWFKQTGDSLSIRIFDQPNDPYPSQITLEMRNVSFLFTLQTVAELTKYSLDYRKDGIDLIRQQHTNTPPALVIQADSNAGRNLGIPIDASPKEIEEVFSKCGVDVRYLDVSRFGDNEFLIMAVSGGGELRLTSAIWDLAERGYVTKSIGNGIRDLK
ncbi:MAG: hypothetical protein JJU29_24040 [Verrucomicrobia bacterium]|nr:hypothetical protein [Verrucomicrobiota bacterium]